MLYSPRGRKKDGSGEESSRLIEIRGSNRMERRLTGKYGGGLGRKEEKAIWNGGVEEAGSFKKNGPILYFSRNEHFLSISPAPLPDSFF